MLFSNALLVVAGGNQALLLCSLHVKILSSQNFDLDIENPLGGCKLAKFRSSM
jgi:hypothetical protein